MSELRRKSKWGVGIAVVYSAFVVATLVFAIFASNLRFDLTEENYYDKGITYQQEIDTAMRTASLPKQPSVDYDRANGSVAITFPPEIREGGIAGHFALRRPSDAALDTQWVLSLDTNGTQRIDVSLFQKGLWRSTLSWSHGGAGFAKEFMIVVE